MAQRTAQNIHTAT